MPQCLLVHAASVVETAGCVTPEFRVRSAGGLNRSPQQFREVFLPES